MKLVYVVTNVGTQKRWSRIGVAFTNSDGSLHVKLDAIPVSGELFIRKYPADAKDPPEAQVHIDTLEAENVRLRDRVDALSHCLLIELSSVGRVKLEAEVLTLTDSRERAWKLLRELGVTVMP